MRLPRAEWVYGFTVMLIFMHLWQAPMVLRGRTFVHTRAEQERTGTRTRNNSSRGPEGTEERQIPHRWSRIHPKGGRWSGDRANVVGEGQAEVIWCRTSQHRLGRTSRDHTGLRSCLRLLGIWRCLWRGNDAPACRCVCSRGSSGERKRKQKAFWMLACVFVSGSFRNHYRRHRRG
ncbi:hypothetical protein BC628DRAFT_45311 [Trametes gibbosa]|nr:hypothetical protein BC628DRAFT_45311 [Trametes gibbosa]